TCALPIFFFQAEDGIRGRNVTGVQTCALPISTDATRSSASTSSADCHGSCGPGPSAASKASTTQSCGPAAVGTWASTDQRNAGEIGRASCREREASMEDAHTLKTATEIGRATW